VNYKGPVTTKEEDNQILLQAYKLRDKFDESYNNKKAAAAADK
jgi:hypothetical protein